MSERWVPWLALAFVLACLVASPRARANTLGPGHPAWRTPGVDAASLRAELQEIAARAQTAPVFRAPVARAAAAASSSSVRDSMGGVQPQGYHAFGARMLVVPVLFSDGPDVAPLSRDELQRRLFDDSDPGSLVSVFSTISRGAFAPSGYVVPWVRLPRTRAYYSNVRDGRGVGNAGPHQLVRHAVCEAAQWVDVTAFDDDGPDGIPGSGDDDGVIDLLLVLHPDVPFEVDPLPTGSLFLSHMDRAQRDSIRADCNVGADPYVLASALGPLGVWAHECMHLLGLEDLYDISVTGDREQQPQRGGLGIWSLMADGTWGGNGATPSDLDAVSRAILGWGTALDASQGGAFSLAPSLGPGAPYLIVNPLGRWEGESFAAEVRGPVAGRVVDAALPGTGVVVYHIDDAVPLNCTSPQTCASRGAWVEVAQADGRNDLEQLVNNGDAGDVFTGAANPDVLGPLTNPSSASHRPGPEREPPVLRIGPADAAGAHEIDVQLAAAPRLKLSRALFLDVLSPGGRAWLRPGETLDWDLRFMDAGPTATTADLRVLAEDPGIDVRVSGSVALHLDAGEWVPVDPIAVQATASASLDVAPVVSLGLTVDGGVERQLDLGVPIGFGPGLRADAFGVWTPVVLAAPLESTSFETLPPAELPLPTAAGWTTLTSGQQRYAAGVDLAVTSPWFASAEGAAFGMWSHMDSEASQPGDAWDGGALEFWDPEQGWRPLEPSGVGIVRIVHRSTAAIRGRVGWGGGSATWMPATADLPQPSWPTRLRLRFASNESIQRTGWQVAGAGTEPAPGKALLHAQRQADGRVTVDALVDGALANVTRLRLAFRHPLDSTWTDVEPARNYTPGSTSYLFTVDLAGDGSELTFGLFSDESPRLLLGTTGFRSPRPGGRVLWAAPNPARGQVQLVVEASDAARHLSIFDVRGRMVRQLTVEAFLRLAIWDGRDSDGAPVASGRYVVVLTDPPGGSTVLTWLR